jgi:uncharacterized NAD-dependent epimerase/dehydratase family protein
VELYSVRIFDASLSTGGKALIAALKWAIALEMDVVNLSLGSTDTTLMNALFRVCRQARDAGVLVVAAEHNEGRESYPAIFPEVIGVAAGKGGGVYDYSYRPKEKIECVARGYVQRLCWLNHREIMTGGTSFAAPHITAIVALIRQAHPGADFQQVCRILQENASNTIREPVRGFSSVQPPAPVVSESTCPEWIKKAALYPYNKEMHALVRGRELLDFEIVGVADPVGKGMVGKDAGEAIGTAPLGVRIVPQLAAALENADSLILGYVDQLGRIAQRDVLCESIDAALERGLHVFSFLAVPRHAYSDLYAKAHRKGLRITYPFISTDEIKNTIGQTGDLGPVTVPVLGIFGTSSQQGKFTVQLGLRRRLLEMGYKVGQIGTEHHAQLFGMDLVFPMGYASPLNMPYQHYAPYLEVKMREISWKTPDIILVGSQSGTIPYDVHESSTHSLPSLAFLLGTKPDACVLVVNSIDPDDYIQDTLDALRVLGKAPTILLAMSDKEKHIRAAYGRTLVQLRQMPCSEIVRKLQYLEDKFGLSAVEIASEGGQRRMVDTVVGHFASGGDSGQEKRITKL